MSLARLQKKRKQIYDEESEILSVYYVRAYLVKQNSALFDC